MRRLVALAVDGYVNAATRCRVGTWSRGRFRFRCVDIPGSIPRSFVFVLITGLRRLYHPKRRYNLVQNCRKRVKNVANGPKCRFSFQTAKTVNFVFKPPPAGEVARARRRGGRCRGRGGRDSGRDRRRGRRHGRPSSRCRGRRGIKYFRYNLPGHLTVYP